MDTLENITLTTGAAWASGINLYATIGPRTGHAILKDMQSKMERSLCDAIQIH
ncbi:MAG: hypothetical protein ACREX4_02165 [Gammaproteobacteria bacterium]